MALKPAALWRCIGAARALGAARRADGEARRHVQPAAAPNGRCLRAVPRRLPRPERPGEAGAAPPRRRGAAAIAARERPRHQPRPRHLAHLCRAPPPPPPRAAAVRRRQLLARLPPPPASLPHERAAHAPRAAGRARRSSAALARRRPASPRCSTQHQPAEALRKRCLMRPERSLGAGRAACGRRLARRHRRHLHERGGGGGGQRRPRATPTARTTRPLAPPALAAPAPAPVGRAPSPSPTHGAVLRRPRGPAAVGRGGCPRRRSRGRAGAARPRPRAARGTPGARARSGQAPPGARASAARPQATRGGRPAARGAGAPRNPAQPPHRRQARRGEGEPHLHRRLAHRHRSQPPPLTGTAGGGWGSSVRRATWLGLAEM